MNILNIATILNDDTTLNDTSLAICIIDRIDMGVREVRGFFTGDMTGVDLERLVCSLDENSRNLLLDLTLLSILETQVMIHDVTTHRKTLQFKNKQQDTWPNRFVLSVALFTICFSVYVVMRYIFVTNTHGIKTEGVIYEWLVKIFGWIKPFIF